jgi:hypothetical protein
MTETDPQTTLITRAAAGDLNATPPLATCSYFEYARTMGTAVRITLGAPRGISLPDPRWTEQRQWPAATILAPGRDYFRKGLPPAEFRDRYLADLEQRGPEAIAAALRAVPDDGTGQLVLLCFEKTAQVEADPWVCHRRIFAAWWEGLTGQRVPELTTP